jgi:hypothetical protein
MFGDIEDRVQAACSLRNSPKLSDQAELFNYNERRTLNICDDNGVRVNDIDQ